MDAAHLDPNPNIHRDISEKEILFITTKGTIEELIAHLSIPTTTPALAPLPDNNRILSDVKLPRIELPKFNGNYESWTSFFDLFTSLVDSNRMLTGSQKLHYLKSSVEGEAAQLIRSYNITDANYMEAWRSLQVRYKNKRFIVNSHLRHILELPKLKLERIKEIN